MATTLTALWNQDPQQLYKWLCQKKEELLYDVNLICDWLKQEKKIAQPTDKELESVETLINIDNFSETKTYNLFEDPSTEHVVDEFEPTSNKLQRTESNYDATMIDDSDNLAMQNNNSASQQSSEPKTPKSTSSSAGQPSRTAMQVDSRRSASQKTKPSSVVLSDIVINIKVLHPAVETFVEELQRELIVEFVLRHTRKRIDMVNDKQHEYQLIEPININDEFSAWKFDVLFGMLQITLKLKDDAPFPLSWSTHRDSTALSVIVTRTEEQPVNEVSLNHPSLEEWLQKVCHASKMLQYYEGWLDFLKKAHVDRLQHLLDWTNERWQALKMPPNAKDVIQRAVGEFRSQESLKPKKKRVSEAELIANVHRIRRFFYYHLGRVNELGFLHPKAVKLAFSEMIEEGYEVDGLFHRIEELLFSETVPPEEPNKGDITDAELRKKNLQIAIVNVNKRISDLVQKKAEYAALSNAEIEKQIQGDEQLTQLTQELNTLKKQFEEHATRSGLSKLAVHKQGRLESQLKNKERDCNLYKKDLTERIIHSEAYVKFKILRRNAQEEIYKLQKQLESLQSLLTSSSKTRSDILKHYRGIIFYGPPGTGKTRLMKEILERVGFTMVVPPLAAAEVNRSLVGQTERLLLDIANRAHLLPHLLCAESIDEIDALAPKRDDKVSQHKLDGLSVLLSVIEGIKDVPNLIILAATNRIKMMDEAFLRRMAGQFFVGRPSSAVRRKLLNELNSLGEGILLDSEVMDYALLLTTNFTPAAIVQLRSNLLSYVYMHTLTKLTKEVVVDQCRVAARQFSITVGGYTLPDLFVNWKSETQLSLTEGDLSGRIHVDLQQKEFQLEVNNADYSTVVPLNTQKKTFLSSVLPNLVQLALDRKIDFVQVFDLSWIMANAAYDDHKVMEILSERINECREYKRAMMIFDLDSLVGVNDNQSMSSMGLSTSNSVNNQRLFSYLVDIAKEAKVQGDEEQWIVTASLHPYLSKTFKSAILFTQTQDEAKKEREEHDRANLHLTCQNCNLTYVEAENKLNCCSYHDGFLVDSGLPARDWSQISEDEAIYNADPSKLLWICCYRNMRDGGCKNNKHQPGQQDKIYKHARAVGLYAAKFDQYKTTSMEKQDRVKPRK